MKTMQKSNPGDETVSAHKPGEPVHAEKWGNIIVCVCAEAPVVLKKLLNLENSFQICWVQMSYYWNESYWEKW